MKSEVKSLSETKRLLSITADDKDLAKIKSHVLEILRPKVKAQGFREGKAPDSVVEKQIGDQALQTEIVEEAINHLYSETLIEQKLRPLDRPQIDVKKYVPGQTLEFTAEVEVIPPVELADYKKLKVKTNPVKLEPAEIDKVIDNLRLRMAEKTEVKRAAKDGDEVWIDFEGFDSKGQSVAGASGKDYPLRLGSKTFIKGFEENLEGAKPGQEVKFKTTFPKDYGVKALAGTQIKFEVKVKQVKQVNLPKVDDNFAKSVGPFTSLEQLKTDIRTELSSQKMQEADNQAKDELLGQLAEKSQATLPEILINDQMENLRQDFIANLSYRGMTLEEYLKTEKLTQDKWEAKTLRPQAERRVKIGLVLSAVADAENLNVSDQEIDTRITVMKQQYQDEKAKAELDKPESRRDVASRILTEKTVNKLMEYASA